MKFRGLLLSVAPEGRAVVSAGGAVIVLEGHSPSAVAPGSIVDVIATVEDDDDLDETQMTVFSPSSPGGMIEGRLTIGTGTIAVTSERQSLVIGVPTGFDLTGFVQGEEVLATFAQLPNGSLALVEALRRRGRRARRRSRSRPRRPARRRRRMAAETTVGTATEAATSNPSRPCPAIEPR